MKHISLFSGIGGFDLAAEWMGWENVAHCELNTFCKKILKYYWPKAISYDNIKTTDFTIHRGKIDILTGGFPCQPYSSAGKRRGKEDERHLWPEMLRAIREIQPSWIVGENVLGIVNWSGGLVFNEVQADLEAAGYEVQPYVLPACGKNAPHRRDRVWFVAHSNGAKQGNDTKENIGSSKEIRREKEGDVFTKLCDAWNASNSDSQGLQVGVQTGFGKIQNQAETSKGSEFTRRITKNYWSEFPTKSPFCTGDDGISSKLDGITFPKWKSESIKAGGNAIVPQVVFEIFKAIDQYNALNR